jgi:polysaccharide biosynthesis protein PslH
MRVLFLTQIVPYPPDAGPRVKTWNVLRFLAQQGHEVILACFVRAEERQHLAKLRTVCRELYPVPLTRSRILDGWHWVRSLRSGRPFLVERDDLHGMREVVATVMGDRSIDVIQADQLSMTQFALPWEGGQAVAPGTAGNGSRAARDPLGADRPLLVFDAHNAVWTIIARMAKTAAPPLRRLLEWEAQRTKVYEGSMVRRFHHTLVVSEPDRAALLEAWREAQPGVGDVGTESRRARGPAISVVPIAADTSEWAPIPRPVGSTNILTMGTLHYPPNADGIRWFLGEVFPRVLKEVPAATLTIVGRNPPKDFYRLARRFPGAVEVTGYVADLQPYLQRAAVFAVPVRSGGGMRVRILEGFARALPTVTTTVGLEGIDAKPGSDILVGDTANEFAARVVETMRAPELQRKLANNGRRLAEARFDWQVVLQALDRVYKADRE